MSIWDVFVGFLNSNQWFIPFFLGDKSDALRLDEKKYGGTKQQMNALLKFKILAMWNFKRVTVNSSLRFPVTNLMLKVSNNEMRIVLLLNLVRLELRSASESIQPI